MIYTHNGILPNHKKMKYCHLRNLCDPRNYYTEWSQTKTNIIYHLYVESKKIQMNLFMKQKQTHLHRKQTYDYQRGKMGEGGVN